MLAKEPYLASCVVSSVHQQVMQTSLLQKKAKICVSNEGFFQKKATQKSFFQKKAKVYVSKET